MVHFTVSLCATPTILLYSPATLSSSFYFTYGSPNNFALFKFLQFARARRNVICFHSILSIAINHKKTRLADNNTNTKNSNAKEQKVPMNTINRCKVVLFLSHSCAVFCWNCMCCLVDRYLCYLSYHMCTICMRIKFWIILKNNATRNS